MRFHGLVHLVDCCGLAHAPGNVGLVTDHGAEVTPRDLSGEVLATPRAHGCNEVSGMGGTAVPFVFVELPVGTVIGPAAPT